MSDEQLLSILLKFTDYLRIGSMLRDLARSFLDWVVSILLWIVDHLSGILYETTKFLGFYQTESMGSKGLLGTLGNFQKFGLGISILLIGAVLFLGKTSETREVPLNFLLMLILTLMLPGMMRDGIKIIHATTNSLKVEQGDLGFKTFKDNLTDVYVLADNGWTTTTPNPPNYLNDRKQFDINEKIEEVPEGDNGDPLKYKLINKKGSEGKEVVELFDGGGGMFNGITKKFFAESYYRWRVDWTATIGTLAALSLAMIISILRASRVAIEMGFDYIWANIIAYFSIRDVKKLKMAIMSLLGGFILLLSIFTMYYVFINWNTFIFTQTNVSSVTKIFGLLAGAWFVYDGPAIIQKTLGIDAGLSTAGAFLMTAGGAKALKGTTALTKGAVKSAANHTVRTGGFLSGLLSDDKKNSEDNGVNSKMKEEKNQQEQNDQNPETDHQREDMPENQREETTETNEQEKDSQDVQGEEAPDKMSDSEEKSSNEQAGSESNGEEGLKNSSINDPETERNDGSENETINDPEIEAKNDPETEVKNASESGISGSIDEKDSNEVVMEEETPKHGTNDPSESSNTEEKVTEAQNKKGAENPDQLTGSMNQGQFESEKNSSHTKQNGTEYPEQGKNKTGDSSNNHPLEGSISAQKESGSNDDSHRTTVSSTESAHPFKKRVNQVIHRSKYENQGKSYIGQQVDRYNRNKEFGQDVREWLKERKNQDDHKKNK
ncbi:pLS20_p028 family conjugation system transmembrane protein [Enterococcus faecium]|uniref:DUF8208 domain-containing protein n=1 Tax=Enterococcus faecium TaxID=1352 RepID=A0A9X3XSR0_ENTFC|nr:hypothetical protein [Enterococcus faecium]MDC4248069.1 hypothetical protein [Enterococcus faecium]